MRRIAVIHAGPMTSAPSDPRPVGVVLAAGAGTRLRPLTELRPKALCPVANRPLVDWALDRVAPHVSRTAVNVHHHREQLLAHLSGRDVHVSVEEPVALGTAGALGRLRDWVAGAAVLLTNADSWSPGGPGPARRGCWTAGTASGRACSAAATRRAADFGDLRYVGSALLPWWSIRDLPPTPAGLYEVSWAGPARGRAGSTWSSTTWCTSTAARPPTTWRPI